MSTDTHQAPLETAPAVHAPAKKSWREERWERRRRRIWFEEILGWILVPVIIMGAYWLAVGLLATMGTSPEAILNGINLILAGAGSP